eukprot:8517442-Alexandrium_andersonii.AAC.1
MDAGSAALKAAARWAAAGTLAALRLARHAFGPATSATAFCAVLAGICAAALRVLRALLIQTLGRWATETA